MRPLPEELASIALEELHETPERIEQDLIILRLWLKQQSHLRARTGDDFLIAFLRRCRYSLEETKKRIEKFFTFYTIMPDLFGGRYVTERVLDINRLGIHYYPEYPRFSDQKALLITRLGSFCRIKYHFREILQYITMALEIIAFENDNAAVAGICQIIDLTAFEVEEKWQMDRYFFKRFFDWIADACPLRIKEIYILSPPKDFQRRITIMKKLGFQQKEPLVVLLKSPEELGKYIPSECLPEEYGGTNGHMVECVAYMDDLLKSYRNYFEQDGNYGTCEELRTQELTTHETGFGVDGSFRSLAED